MRRSNLLTALLAMVTGLLIGHDGIPPWAVSLCEVFVVVVVVYEVAMILRRYLIERRPS